MISTEIAEKYFNFWYKFLRFEHTTKILPVDFNAPWWKILSKQKLVIFIIFGSYYLSVAFWYAFPSLIAYFISKDWWQYLPWLFLARIVSAFGDVIIGNYFNAILQNQTIHSVYFAATQFFLTTDPDNHSTKSSGQIISKVQRGSGSYEDLLDILLFNILPFFVSLSVLGVSFWNVDWKLSLIAVLGLLFITVVSIFFNIFNNQIFEPRLIAVEDEIKAASIENLQQTGYIRALFATNEQNQKMNDQVLKGIRIASTKWTVSDISFYFVILIYYVYVGLLVYYMYLLLQTGKLNEVEVIGLVGTVMVSNGNTLSIGKSIRRLLQRYTYIQDLYSFIRSYGKQSYPVLSGDMKN